MSIDLFVVRPAPLTLTEVASAYAAITKAAPNVVFWGMTEAMDDVSAYFWKVERVSLTFTRPDPEDVQEDDPPELAQPFVVVSSRSGAWPWIEWTALAIAKELGGTVFDPQNGDFFSPEDAEFDLESLEKEHKAFLQEMKPALVSSYWAFVAEKDKSPAALRPFAETFRAVAKEILGQDEPIALSDEQVNLWHTFEVNGSELRVSTTVGMPHGMGRTLHVEGPCDLASTDAFAQALAKRLDLRFRRVDTYRTL